MKNNLKISIPILLLAIMTGAPAPAQELSGKMMEHADGVRTMMGGVYANPAMQWDRYRTSLNRIALDYDYRRAAVPQLLEMGTGHALYGAHINAYVRKERSIIWGRARYQNGRIRNIKFSETADYAVVYPYVMADTIGGGNSKDELYHFMGGFAHRLSAWTIGAEGSYQASMDYRTSDPRPKNLTGDLHAKVGASRLTGHYRIGASLSFRRYKQTNEVKFYNVVSQPVIYHLTGIGTDYYRFRGEYSETYYKGTGWGASADLHPADGNGLYASASMSSLSLHKIISNLNELPLTDLKTISETAETGWLSCPGRHRWGVKVHEAYEERRGTENIFGSAKDNIYPQIASEAQYHSRRIQLALEGIYQLRLPKARYELTCRQAFDRYKETYAEPNRLMQSTAVISMLGIKGSWQRRRCLISLDAAADRTWSSDNRMDLKGTLNDQVIASLFHRYAFLSNHRYGVRGGGELSFDTGRKFCLFVRTDWRYAHYLSTAHANELQIALGVAF